MAYIKIPGWEILYPSLYGDGSAVAITSFTLNASGEKMAFIFQYPKTGTINRGGFRCTTVTQNPSNGLIFSLQGVDASGNPNAVAGQFRIVPTGDIASNTWASTGLVTSDGTDTGAKRSVVRGEIGVAVVEFAGFNVGDAVSIANRIAGPWAQGQTRRAVPYSEDFTTGAWANRSGGTIDFAIQYDDNKWTPITGALPVETTISQLFSSASTPNEVGMKFVQPVAMRAIGFSAYMLVTGTTSSYKFHLYDSLGVELASTTIDPDVLDTPANALAWTNYFTSGTQVELPQGSTYRVTVEATGAGTINLYGFISDGLSFASATPWGENAVATTRTAPGVFSDAVDGSCYAIGLMIDAIDPLSKPAQQQFWDLTAFVRAEGRTVRVPQE